MINVKGEVPRYAMLIMFALLLFTILTVYFNYKYSNLLENVSQTQNEIQEKTMQNGTTNENTPQANTIAGQTETSTITQVGTLQSSLQVQGQTCTRDDMNINTYTFLVYNPGGSAATITSAVVGDKVDSMTTVVSAGDVERVTVDDDGANLDIPFNDNGYSAILNSNKGSLTFIAYANKTSCIQNETINENASQASIVANQTGTGATTPANFIGCDTACTNWKSAGCVGFVQQVIDSCGKMTSSTVGDKTTFIAGACECTIVRISSG